MLLDGDKTECLQAPFRYSKKAGHQKCASERKQGQNSVAKKKCRVDSKMSGQEVDKHDGRPFLLRLKLLVKHTPLGRREVCWKRPPKNVRMVVQHRFVAYRQIRCRSWCASLARKLNMENGADKLGSGGILTVKKISRLAVPPRKGPFLRARGVGVHWVSDSTCRCTCKGAPTCEHVLA